MTRILVRAPNLEVHNVPDGYFVYQGSRDRVSHLNPSAAAIFELCDCSLAHEEVVRRAIKLLGAGDAGEPLIRACIESLIEEGLVRSSPS